MRFDYKTSGILGETETPVLEGETKFFNNQVSEERSSDPTGD